jgi:hypothetical protein
VNRPAALSATLLAITVALSLTSCAAPSEETQCKELKVAIDKLEGALTLAITASSNSERDEMLATSADYNADVAEVTLGAELDEQRDAFSTAVDTALTEFQEGRRDGSAFSAALDDMSIPQVELNAICGWLD